jgi:hypothetical protein
MCIQAKSTFSELQINDGSSGCLSILVEELVAATLGESASGINSDGGGFCLKPRLKLLPVTTNQCLVGVREAKSPFLAGCIL